MDIRCLRITIFETQFQTAETIYVQRSRGGGGGGGGEGGNLVVILVRVCGPVF